MRITEEKARYMQSNFSFMSFMLRIVQYYETLLLINTYNTSITKEAMYVYSNTETHSRNHCCSGKTRSIAYCECVFVALDIQQANSMRLIILSCGLSGSTLFFTLSHTEHDVYKKKRH